MSPVPYPDPAHTPERCRQPLARTPDVQDRSRRHSALRWRDAQGRPVLSVGHRHGAAEGLGSRHADLRWDPDCSREQHGRQPWRVCAVLRQSWVGYRPLGPGLSLWHRGRYHLVCLDGHRRQLRHSDVAVADLDSAEHARDVHAHLHRRRRAVVPSGDGGTRNDSPVIQSVNVTVSGVSIKLSSDKTSICAGGVATAPHRNG